MQRPQISAYKRRYIEDVSKGINIDNTLVFLCLLGFLLGRAVIIDNLGPFGIAYFIYMCKHKKYKIPVFFSIATGIILSHEGSYALKYIITLVAVYLISSTISNMAKEEEGIIKVAFIGFFISAFIGMGISFIRGIYIYDILVSLFEGTSVFVLIYIYSFGIPLILKRSMRRTISNEEIIALSIIIGLSITGVSNISLFEISLKNVLSLLLIIIISYKGGGALGASAGITIGLITTMNTAASPIYIGIYGFSGLLGGLFNKISKYMSVIGFIMGWSIIIIYTRGSEELILSIREVGISSLTFLLIPEEKLKYLERFTKGILGSEESALNYMERVKEILHSRLKDIQQAYFEIGTTFEKVREKDKILDQRDIASVVDMINCDVCSKCGMKRSCWGLKFNHTYSLFVRILNILEEEGKIDENLVPKDFERYCINPSDVIKSANHYFDLFMLDYKWNKKLSETRKLVSNQIKSISNSIGNVANELNEEIDFDLDMENNIIIELDKENIKVDKISFLRREGENFEINIEKNACYGGSLCEEQLIPTVSRAVGKRLTSYKLGCRSISDKCSIRLVNSQEYMARTHVSSLSKDGNIVSGDNYTYMEIWDGKYMIALSDGMGKGEKACEESSLTIEILEKMMESKINEEISIDTINNMLMLKSSDEIFSTVDLSIVDLKDGAIESVKMGACPSFIKRGKGGVEVISSSSLPVGIISEIKIDRDKRRIKEGDFIIMVSDGIIDAGKDKHLGENWLYTVIEKIDKTSPSEMSKVILDEALKLVDGNAQDDMTVMVTKIWKN
ncbi:stage II sporulation protein E [Tepidibacter formicigenes]|uniref:Stage II sporulation protein E n=1 Tax=Tepidibacter formicigenes DSM 15518 TaxID=1123349 RepID=A0A1M6NTE9_9FIRM|nr:stage II sporulation protein E [Tepidibacter formicigenes]SHJ99007.1 stage II sporulation protein E [Tepidibacter formicigenes DSM 15518]